MYFMTSPAVTIRSAVGLLLFISPVNAAFHPPRVIAAENIETEKANFETVINEMEQTARKIEYDESGTLVPTCELTEEEQKIFDEFAEADKRESEERFNTD